MEKSILVCWVNDIPKKFSLMSRNDIVDGTLRGHPEGILLSQTISVKWNRRVCAGQILAFGSKSDLEIQLANEIQKAGDDSISQISTNTLDKRKRANVKPSASAKQCTAKHSIDKQPENKKSRIDSVLLSLENYSEELNVTSTFLNPNDSENLTVDKPDLLDEKDMKITSLQKKLEDQIEMNAKISAELDEAKATNVELMRGTENTTNIGSGLLLNSDSLSTLRTVSSSVNTFSRNLFRLVFSIDEVKGRSLMGKSCNANKGKETLPSVDPARRDAIIDYSLKTFGKQPGSELYKLAIKDLKKSLTGLIQEMNSTAIPQVEWPSLMAGDSIS